MEAGQVWLETWLRRGAEARHDPESLKTGSEGWGGDEAAACALAYAFILALEKRPLVAWLREILFFLDGKSLEFDEIFLRVGHVLGWANPQQALAYLGKGGGLASELAQAYYRLQRHPDNLQQACVLAAFHPTVAYLTERLGAAYHQTAEEPSGAG
jgi:hypothetical protein